MTTAPCTAKSQQRAVYRLLMQARHAASCVTPPRHPVAAIVICVASLWLSSCASMQTAPSKPNLSAYPDIRTDFRLEVLKGRMQEYAITFGAEVDRVAASIQRRTNDVNVQRNALTWRLRSVPEMRKACFRPEPIPALLDAWTLARQMEALVTTGAAANAFGPFQQDVVGVSNRLTAAVRDIGGYIAASPDARDRIEHDLIESWATAHPLGDLDFARESAIARFTEQMRDRGELFQSVGTIEEMLISLTNQMRIYLADMPKQVRGEVDLLRSDSLPPSTVEVLLRDLSLTAGAADRAARTVELMPALVREERQAVLDDLARQRVLLMQELGKEREMALQGLSMAIASERDVVMKTVDAERLATLDWGTVERREVVTVVHQEFQAAVAALHEERIAAMDDARRMVNGVLLKVALFALLAVVLAPVVAHAYVRVWPQRRT